MAESEAPQEQKRTVNVTIRPLREDDLDAADRIVRLAFGTFLGLPDPLTFMGDAAMVHNRWRADPGAALAAELNGELVGSNFVTHWGSVGFFGPLTVRPDLWDAGVAQQLLQQTMPIFAARGVTHAGLFTFPHSTKHIHLYQKYDFWARFLTPLMAKPVSAPNQGVRWSTYAEAPESERERLIAACARLTDASYPGLDLAIEIRAVAAQQLGDTVLLWNGDSLAGFAVCHCGPRTEAGSDTCYVKFGAVQPGAAQDFDALLDACEAFAAARGVSQVFAGVNMSHHAAYCQMIGRGFRTRAEGVAMQRGNEPGYHRPAVYLIDDWR